jgi:predicted aldo/keto reductase-like oxidoreductase
MAQSINRRSFLKLGALSAGAGLGCNPQISESESNEPFPAMRYRKLGATGLEVSEVAFGAHGVDNVQLMSTALEAGINTFCTSGHYLDGLEEKALGEALTRIGGPREKVVILTGNPVQESDTQNTILADIDDSLRRLGTDYIDVYYHSMAKDPNLVRLGTFFEAIQRAKQTGKVRFLGVSGHHGNMLECLEIAMESGQYEVFFTKYDFVSYPEQDDVLRRATQKGIGTLVFKTNAGNRQNEIKDLEAGGLSYRQATIRWALTNPDVASVAVTLANFDQIRECVGAVGKSLDGAEVAMLRRYAEEMFDKYCRFCATCETTCAQNVAIADIMRYDMYFCYYGREKEAMSLYRDLPSVRTAETCDRCSGHCDVACPFGRQVRDNLVNAHKRLSFSKDMRTA